MFYFVLSSVTLLDSGSDEKAFVRKQPTCLTSRRRKTRIERVVCFFRLRQGQIANKTYCFACQVVLILLQHGAETSLVDSKGRTAASLSTNQAILDMISESGAFVSCAVPRSPALYPTLPEVFTQKTTVPEPPWLWPLRLQGGCRARARLLAPCSDEWTCTRGLLLPDAATKARTGKRWTELHRLCPRGTTLWTVQSYGHYCFSVHLLQVW